MNFIITMLDNTNWLDLFFIIFEVACRLLFIFYFGRWCFNKWLTRWCENHQEFLKSILKDIYTNEQL